MRVSKYPAILLVFILLTNSLAQSSGTPSKDPFEVYQEKSVQLNQVYAKEYLSLAKWCKTKRLFGQARENLELVLKYEPENKQAQNYLDKGFPKDVPEPENMEQLLKQYDRKLVALYKKLADKHTNLGIACRRNKLFREAEQEFNRAIELCADHKKTVKAREELVQYKVEGLGWFDKNTAAKLRKGLRKYKGKWLPKAKVEKLRQNWEDAWEIKTRHYLIRTNNTYEKGIKIGQWVEDLYRMYFQILGKTIRLREPKGLMPIYYFKSEEEYKSKYREAIGQLPPKNAFGMYETQTRIAYSWGPQTPPGGHPTERDIIRHECAHQLNHLVASGPSSSWLEEGLAAYFESVKRDKNGRLTIGDINQPRYGWEAEGKAGGFRRAMETQCVIKLKRFLQLRAEEMINIKYSHEQATALIRFFLNSKAGQKYKDRFLEYVRRCYTASFDPKKDCRVIDSLKAFQECFPKVDLDELHKEFLAGWDK